jgi:outer membrane biosynthesis protein TonB
LNWWDRFQTADGWFAATARFTVAASVVGAVIFAGAALAFGVGTDWNASAEPALIESTVDQPTLADPEVITPREPLPEELQQVPSEPELMPEEPSLAPADPEPAAPPSDAAPAEEGAVEQPAETLTPPTGDAGAAPAPDAQPAGGDLRGGVE